MEQFYAGMQSISLDRRNINEDYFTLEIALDSKTDQVVIYAGIPNKHLTLFEKANSSFYNDKKLNQ